MKFFKSSGHKFTESVIKSLSRRGHKSIKANHGDYKRPAKVIKKSTNSVFIPEISSKKDDRLWLYSVVTPADLNHKDLITKWKLFHEFSIQSGCRFYIVFRKGMLQRIREMLEENSITAELWDFDKKK